MNALSKDTVKVGNFIIPIGLSLKSFIKHSGIDSLKQTINECNNDKRLLMLLLNEGSISGCTAFRLLPFDHTIKIYNKVNTKNMYKHVHIKLIGMKITLCSALQIYVLVKSFMKNFIYNDVCGNDLESLKSTKEHNKLLDSLIQSKLTNFENKMLFAYGFGPENPSQNLLTYAKKLFVDNIDENIIYKFWFTYTTDKFKEMVLKNKFYIKIYKILKNTEYTTNENLLKRFIEI